MQASLSLIVRVAVSFTCSLVVASRCLAVSVIVSGLANPWLAGMPGGSQAGNGYDTAPAESPVLVPTLTILGGEKFTFSATGIVSHGFFDSQGHGPSGDFSSVTWRTPGPENGIGDTYAPMDSLMGVFLSDGAPNIQPPPVPPYAFANNADCDFLTLAPALKQPFYIGDGLTSLGTVQQFIAPAGATRLYLGVMDNFQWSNNTGSFQVNITSPLPGDVNADGIVNGQDLALVASNWLLTGSQSADVNGDSIVNGQDIALVASNWLQATVVGNATALPEPSSLLLTAVGLISCWAVGRR